MAEYPHTTDYPDYHPHMTIAYVKKGMGKKYAEDLKDFSITPDKFVYSKIDGTNQLVKSNLTPGLKYKEN